MAVVSGVALFLRVVRLEIECASRDECSSWRIVQYPVIEQTEQTAADVHPPHFGFFITVAHLVFVAGLIAFQTFVQRTQIARQHALGVTVAVGIAVALYTPWAPAQLAQIQQVQGA